MKEGIVRQMKEEGRVVRQTDETGRKGLRDARKRLKGGKLEKRGKNVCKTEEREKEGCFKQGGREGYTRLLLSPNVFSLASVLLNVITVDTLRMSLNLTQTNKPISSTKRQKTQIHVNQK